MTGERMTDVEVICTWMEPRPTKSIIAITAAGEPCPGKWWDDKHPADAYWYPRRLTLDALWEVEERLTDEQWQAYVTEVSLICFDSARGEMRYDGGWSRILLHATPEQKIKALAAILRPIVEAL